MSWVTMFRDELQRPLTNGTALLWLASIAIALTLSRSCDDDVGYVVTTSTRTFVNEVEFCCGPCSDAGVDAGED